MIVLGVDPGIAHTGYGVVESRGGRLLALDGGTFETPKSLSTAERLQLIHERVAALIDEHGPSEIAVESLFFGANADSAVPVAQAMGVVLLAAAQRGLAAEHYNPQQVKSSVCGSGRAAKAEVQRMVAALLRLDAPPRSDHAADALAVAICHHNRAPLSAAKAGAAA
jgi:crossover junction endodeoxyribonuclease RuvC